MMISDRLRANRKILDLKMVRYLKNISKFHMLVALAKYRAIILNTLSYHDFHTYGLVVDLILATCFLVSIYKLTWIKSTIIAFRVYYGHDQGLQNTFRVINIIIKPVQTLEYTVSFKYLLYKTTMMKPIAPTNAVPSTPPTIASMFGEGVTNICGNKI